MIYTDIGLNPYLIHTYPYGGRRYLLIEGAYDTPRNYFTRDGFNLEIDGLSADVELLDRGFRVVVYKTYRDRIPLFTVCMEHNWSSLEAMPMTRYIDATPYRDLLVGDERRVNLDTVGGAQSYVFWSLMQGRPDFIFCFPGQKTYHCYVQILQPSTCRHP
ncbi:MAG: hypothetical protein ACOCXQ_04435 [Patescibacteria group bacterium]